MSYENRSIESGHPAGSSTCPQCKAPLYFAAELNLRDGSTDRVEKNVVYCSGGCGWLKHVAKEVGEVAKDTGIAAAEVAADIAVSGLGAFQE